MQIHLSDISSSEGKSQHYSVAFEMDTITFQQGTFLVLAKEPVELTITNTGDRVLELEGSGLVTVGIPCDRCLEEVRTKIPFEFKRKLDMKLTDEERVNVRQQCMLMPQDTALRILMSSSRQERA